MSKPFSFRDMIVVDQTEGSWDDAIGLIAYQYKKRRRGIIGESHDSCPDCDEEPCECDESFEAQFDAMTPTDEAEDTLDEATKPGSKIIITQGTHKGETARIGEINLGLHKDDKSYVIDLQGGSNITLRRGAFKLVAAEKMRKETLDEATLSREQEMAKNSDFDRMMAGAMKRDDYNKKWKLGQYKPAAGSSFVAHMLSQPVKKKV